MNDQRMEPFRAQDAAFLDEEGGFFNARPATWPGCLSAPDDACLALCAALGDAGFPPALNWRALDGSRHGWLIFGPTASVKPLWDDFVHMLHDGARGAWLGFPQALGKADLAGARWDLSEGSLALIHAHARNPRLPKGSIALRFGPGFGSLAQALGRLADCALNMSLASQDVKARAKERQAQQGLREGFVGNMRIFSAQGLVAFSDATGIDQALLILRAARALFVDIGLNESALPLDATHGAAFTRDLAGLRLPAPIN